jgi:hypothetical protein
MKSIDTILSAHITRICTSYAELTDTTKDEAIRIFMGSATYHALMKTETGLCYEMFDAIYEMFLEEMGYDIQANH